MRRRGWTIESPCNVGFPIVSLRYYVRRYEATFFPQSLYRGRVLNMKFFSAEKFLGFMLVLGVSGASLNAFAAPHYPLQIYFVDVEGGQATLFVTPSQHSLLIDTGWPEHE